jgi:succinoglycan biosynthesis transport protein ExoP
MLQTTKTSPSDWASEPEISPSAMLRERIDFVIGFLRRRYLGILVFLLLSLGCGALYLFITPPNYTASATMMIDTRKAQFLQQSVLGDVPIDSSWMDTQIGSIKSENVALNAVKQLHLADDPKFARYEPKLLHILPAPILLMLPSPISRFLGLTSAQGAISEGDLARQIAAGLDPKRVGVSYMVRIDFSSYDPEQTVKIVNAIVDAYITEQLNAKFEANRRTSDWLQERFQTLREQAAAAERAVVDFKTKNNILTAGGKPLNEQAVGDLNTQLGTARAHLADVQAHLARIEEIIRQDQPDAPPTDATVSEAMNNPIIEKLRSQYLDVQNREAAWKIKYGANHIAVVNLRSQMREIRGNMLNELGRIAETYKSDIEIAKSRQSELEKQLAEAVTQSQNPSQTALHNLESAAESYHTLYSSFLQRYMESVQQQSFPVNEARLLSPASGAYKSKPQNSFVWAIALAAGGMLGLAFGALRELMDGVFRTSAQVRSALETECLALVPLLKNNGSEERARRPDDRGAPRTICSNSRMLQTVTDAPLSQYSEALRSVKLDLDLTMTSKSARVLGFTSSLPDEGKSTIAAGIAQVMALGGARVILVDCDLRNPSLSSALAPEASAGLVDVVAGTVPLAEAVWREPGTKLDFLPASGRSTLANSSEILAADATRQLFDTLRLKYDYILVDLSPLIPIVDARAVARWVDFYILVIEWGRTRIETVQNALSDARIVQANIMGAVLNKADMRLIGKYERQNPRYQRNKSFARYGYHG